MPFWTILGADDSGGPAWNLDRCLLYHRVSELDFKRACFILLGIAGWDFLIKALLRNRGAGTRACRVETHLDTVRADDECRTQASA